MSDDLPASSGDAERDAWLREALRHAPDATAAPPRGLSDAILREARSATAPGATAAIAAAASTTAAPVPAPNTAASARPAAVHRRPWWRAAADVWASLGRGQMATSFAGVLAAVLVGLVWWEQPMDEAMPRPPAPSAPVTSTTAAPSAVPAVPITPPIASPIASPIAPPIAPPITPPAAPPPVAAEAREKADHRFGADAPRALAKDAARKQADEAPPSAFPAGEKAKLQQREESEARSSPGKSEDALASASKQAAARPQPPTPPLEAQPRSANAEPSIADALGRRDKAELPAAAMAPVPPPPAPVRAPAPAVAPAPAPEPAPVAAEIKEAKAAAAEPGNRLRTAPASVTSSAAPSTASLLAGNAARSTLAAAAPAQPLRSLLERLTSEAPAWRRQTSGGNETGLDPAAREWLASIDAAASGWVVVEPPPADQRAAIGRLEDGSRSELRLLHDGQLAAVVRIEAGAVVMETRGDGPPRTWRAALPAERASRLKASLPALPR